MSGGWTPSVHLFSQSRGKLVFDEALQLFRPGASAQRERSAGACNATFDLAAALAEGDAAGRAAATAAGFAAPGARTYAVSDNLPAFGAAHIDPPAIHTDRRAKAFVDFQNDVCAKDVSLAVQEGMRSIEHIKRYTTTGMATDQGKLSNMNALGIAAAELKKPIPEVGLTTFRPPYTPVTFGAFAGPARGDLFDPIRRTPIHDWAAENGAAFEDVGLWKRAWYFPKSGETMHDAVARECRTTRASVGLFDATTLGKIEVVGPDAATFLERMYANAFQKLEVGRCRYGLMLSEAGFLMDDGVIARIKPDRFHVTTTTGGAPRVLAHMEDYLQTEFTDLRVWATSTTEQWATIAVQGPRARETIAPLVEGVDLSGDALPHMSLREARICGVPTRLMRVSFTGELGYEINVPSHFGRPVWEAVWREVQKHGGCAYGTEAMHVMRAEKGYVIVGQETDGTVTLADLGLDGMIGKTKKDFVGKRSLTRPDMLVEQSQAAGRAPDGQSGDRARRGRTGDGKREPADRLIRARPRHVVLHERGSRPSDRARSCRRGAIANGLEAPRPDARRRRQRDGRRARFSMTRRERASMADAALQVRSPLEGFAFPAGPRFTLSEAAPAARFILRGSEAVRVSCGMAFGADLPSRLGSAGEGTSRAALWLGPDEWLLIADGADAAISATCWSRCSREPRIVSSTSRIGRSASSPAARPRRASSTPAARSISTSRRFRSASRRALCSTRSRSCSGAAPRRPSMSKSGDRSRPISRARSPRPRAARRSGEVEPSDSQAFAAGDHRPRRALAKLPDGDLGHLGGGNPARSDRGPSPADVSATQPGETALTRMEIDGSAATARTNASTAELTVVMIALPGAGYCDARPVVSVIAPPGRTDFRP